MEPAQFRKQLTIRDHAARKLRQLILITNVLCQFPECLRAETKRTVNIAIRGRRFTRMGLISIDEEHLPGRSCMRRTPIPVLLDAALYHSYDEMLMRMTRKSMLHIMRMHNLRAMRSIDLVHANPLRRRHQRALHEATNSAAHFRPFHWCRCGRRHLPPRGLGVGDSRSWRSKNVSGLFESYKQVVLRVSVVKYSFL